MNTGRTPPDDQGFRALQAEAIGVSYESVRHWVHQELLECAIEKFDTASRAARIDRLPATILE